MQHIITDEEVERFNNIYTEHDGNDKASSKAALADFLNNRPQVAQLRPIAEMSEKVPEGCVRLQGTVYSDNVLGAFTKSAHQMDTHAVDVFLQLPTPDPDAEERRQFEEAMKNQKKWSGAMFLFKNGEYESPSTESHYDTWKLAKKGGDK